MGKLPVCYKARQLGAAGLAGWHESDFQPGRRATYRRPFEENRLSGKGGFSSVPRKDEPRPVGYGYSNCSTEQHARRQLVDVEDSRGWQLADLLTC